MFDWYVIREDQRGKIVEDTCLQEIKLCLQILINSSTLNSEYNREDLCIQWRSQQTCTCLL